MNAHANVIPLRSSDQLRLAVDVIDDSALLRVLTVARQRGYPITAVEFAAGDRHRPPRLELGVRAGRGDGQRLAAQLERLVDVAAVRI